EQPCVGDDVTAEDMEDPQEDTTKIAALETGQEMFPKSQHGVGARYDRKDVDQIDEPNRKANDGAAIKQEQDCSQGACRYY
ncbi:MAG: hypothetical protein ACREVJ_16150, partial [Gammaproteobacteria bacterium]